MFQYTNLKSLEHIYLEDSYVLCIIEKKFQVIFEMEFVLCKTHPLYSNPKIGEHYCYKNGQLIFNNVISINWIIAKKALNIVKDDIDYGNIDSMEFLNNKYCIEGDWGEVEINLDIEPQVEFE
ncbi:MAG: hypothetical protein ABI207_02860 [Crocinitomicaceae bacterium]